MPVIGFLHAGAGAEYASRKNEPGFEDFDRNLAAIMAPLHLVI
jgi:hypothetical protein